MQQVQNPIFGGAIPMDFGLPQASQIPAGFQVRQFTPGEFNPAPKRTNSRFNGQQDGGDMYAYQAGGFNDFSSD